MTDQMSYLMTNGWFTPTPQRQSFTNYDTPRVPKKSIRNQRSMTSARSSANLERRFWRVNEWLEKITGHLGSRVERAK